jgi:hypothetical protein
MNQTQIIPKNEIDALWAIFKQYKKLIITITFISFLLSILYVTVWYKPIYKAIALMQIGKLNGILIEQTKVLNIKLGTKYSNIHNKYPKIVKIKLYDNTMGIIRVDANGYSEKTLNTYLKNIIKEISQEHNISYSKYLNNTIKTFTHFSTLVEDYKKDIEVLKRNIQEDEQRLKQLQVNEQVLINMYTLKLLRDDTVLNRTEKKLIVANASMIAYRNRFLPTKTYNTHLFDKVQLQSILVSTDKSVIVIAGVIAGLLFSFLIAFLLSFLSNRRD